MNTDVETALRSEDSSVRLQAALSAGSNPDADLLDVLVERCAAEPDFFVRDMLSWALLRLPPDVTLQRLHSELDSNRSQARSQALHTLSKIGDERAWAWITPELLSDSDDEVARTAWRAAVILVPDAHRVWLSSELTSQLGRGDRDMQLSLSRALVALGEVVEPDLATAANSGVKKVAMHARAVEQVMRDPSVGFDAALTLAEEMIDLGIE